MLTSLFNVKDPEPRSRLMRRRLKLKEHQYEVVYKVGASNITVNVLNRIGQVTLTKFSISNILYSYQEYLNQMKNTAVIKKNVKKEDGDLFETTEESILVHCVCQKT